MSIFNRPINELNLVSILLVALLTILLLFDRDFGLIYIAMIVIWFVFYISDKLFGNKIISFPVERDSSQRFMNLFIAIGVYTGFLLLSSFITNLLTPGALPSGSLIEIIKTQSADMYQASTPVLKDSLILMFIGWALIIPIIETAVTGKVFEALYDRLRNKTLITIIILALIVGAEFAILHLTSKSGDSTSLIITFVFFTVTSILIWVKKDLFAAILLHIIANGVAVGVPLFLK